MTTPKNIILITVDSLRADHLGFMGYSKNISPNIDSLAKESFVFKNAFSTGPETSYSFPSILTSTYPLDYNGPLNIKKPRLVISEVFKRNGFATAAFHSNPYLSEFFGYNKGWDFFEDLGYSATVVPESSLKMFLKKIILFVFPEILFWAAYLKYRIGRLKKEGKKGIKVSAEFLNRTAGNFLSVADTAPFFVWIHYMDVHTPYLPEDKYGQEKPLSYSELLGDIVSVFFQKNSEKKALKKFLDRKIRKTLPMIINSYDQSIEYCDEKIGELLSFLKKENIYENTIICITADHGDEFLEHGGLSHGSRLYNELLHVPLLIKIPGKDAKIIENKVSLIDLAPTLCNLFKIESPANFKGKNLLETGEKVIFHQAGFSGKGGDCNMGVERKEQCKVACQNGNWKYILDHGTGAEELYSLTDDAKEQNNLCKSKPKIISKMRDKIKEFEKINPPLNIL